jgi:hypothetical protein
MTVIFWWIIKMADIKKRYDEQPALSPALMASDISCVSRSPFGSGAPFQKYTQAQLAEFMQNYLTFSTELAIVNVSKAGNDSTADGSLQFPFLTIRAAQLSISDASASKVYTIVPQPGTYIETGLTFMPFQYISALVPETVIVSLTNDMGWDPTWLLQSPVGGLINLNFSGAGRVRPINAPAGYTHNGVLNFLNCDIPYFNINYARDIVTTINNCKMAFYETNRSDISLINCRIVDSFIQSGITRVNNCAFTGTGLITSTLGSDDIYIYNSQIDGSFTISGSGVNLYCDAPSYPSNLIVANSATVNRLTTSETVLTDYTPVNFTATDSSVRGAIEGIDNAIEKPQTVIHYTPPELENALVSGGGTLTLSEDSDLKYLDWGNIAFVSINVTVPLDHVTGSPIYVRISAYTLVSSPDANFSVGRLINKDGSSISRTILTASSIPMDLTSTDTLKVVSGLVPDITTVAAGDVLTILVGRDYVFATNPRVLSIEIIF